MPLLSPDNKIQLPDILAGADGSWIGAGTGWQSYKDRLLPTTNSQLQTILPDCLPSAEVMVKLAVEELKAGNTVTAAEAIPVYLRNNVAKKPKPIVF